jgi:hypothetical protein
VNAAVFSLLETICLLSPAGAGPATTLRAD